MTAEDNWIKMEGIPSDSQVTICFLLAAVSGLYVRDGMHT